MNEQQKAAGMASWKRTLNNAMKGNGGYMVTMDTCGRTCALCDNPNNLQRCGRCFRVFYCSKDCQRADWRKHKWACQQVTSQAVKAREEAGLGKGRAPSTGGWERSETATTAADMAGDSIKTCKKCKTTSASVKTCARCGTTSYCSKECQREDWPQHKPQCKKAAKTKVETDWEAGKMFQDLAQAMDPNQAFPVRRSRNPALTWEKAIQETCRMHPDKTIITRLKDVTEEEDLDPVVMTSTVFLARLARPHPYVFRNAWYLEDSKGSEVRVFFYLDHDKPEPYFTWRQLDRGNFLCLEHAYIHIFLDGTRGIRVDDACDVSIIGD